MISVTRTGIAVVAVVMLYSGALLLWQLANQPSTDGCYTFPVGVGVVFSAFKMGCPFNTLPNYYAGDVGVMLILLGSFLTFVKVTGGRGR